MRAEMVAMTPESVVWRQAGLTLASYVINRLGGDQRDANRIGNDRRWRYGSWRPSYRAVLIVDGREDYPPYADDLAVA